jgi:hypothetical protein
VLFFAINESIEQLDHEIDRTAVPLSGGKSGLRGGLGGDLYTIRRREEIYTLRQREGQEFAVQV